MFLCFYASMFLCVFVYLFSLSGQQSVSFLFYCIVVSYRDWVLTDTNRVPLGSTSRPMVVCEPFPIAWMKNERLPTARHLESYQCGPALLIGLARTRGASHLSLGAPLKLGDLVAISVLASLPHLPPHPDEY